MKEEMKKDGNAQEKAFSESGADQAAAAEETKKASKENRNRKRRTGKGRNLILHFLQHICLMGAAVSLVVVMLGSHVSVELKDGIHSYSLSAEDKEGAYEDSELYNSILGNSVSNIICYGAIRGQMETAGKFNPRKEVDVTAFAGRYDGLKEEYITAEYYVEDLIKWAQNGFEYEDVFMTGEEADNFLSRYRTVTFVDLNNSYNGGTISYLNSNAASHTKVVDVSGNIIDSGDGIRDDVNATLLNNRYHTIDGKNIENYVSSWEEYYELCGNVRKAAEDLKINYEEYLSYQDYYNKDHTNVVYYIRKTIGRNTEVFSNQKVNTKNLSELEKDLKEKCGSYLIYDPKNMKYETNTRIEESTVRYILNGYEYSYPEDTQILIGVNTNYPVADAFAQGQSGYNDYAPYFWQYLTAGIVCTLLYLFLLVMLTMREGKVRRKETGELVIRLHQEDRIPTEIMLLFAAAAAAAILFVFKLLASGHKVAELLYSGELPVFAGIAALIVSILFSFFYYSLVRRIRAHTLWKNSLLRKCFERLKKGILYLYDNGAVVLRVFVPYGVFVLVNVIFTVFAGSRNHSGTFVMVLLVVLFLDGLIGVLLYQSAKARQEILKGIQRINEGDMEHKIEETTFHGDNLVLARAVNSIGDGIRAAVATSMKDERLKADLITNVSHDIKTPLTSIINYVDLIKRENVENPKVKEYIEVLDTKSQRLKQLTDDLVEASKISSGNIILQWEKINMVELLNQTIGEFSEKFESKSLTPVFRTGKSSIFIEADSRRIWRVIENLFNNIFKYALEGTRVYIDLAEIEKEKGRKQVALSIRNISRNPLKVDTEELTERFIRGDESRTTEGSGLGLSIAKNLTEIQKGKFEIQVDGDLFKVILTFPLLEDV